MEDFGIGFDPAWSAPTISAPFSFNLPSFNLGSIGDFFSGAGNVARALAPFGDLAKTGIGTYLGIQQQGAQAKYQKKLQDYYANRQKMETEYNAQVQDYLQRRSEWEANMQGMFGETMGEFAEGMGEFQNRLGSIIEQEMDAARPMLAQSQELLEPAVAALAKGEVPPLWQPIFEQVKNRARAAALQQFASAGIDVGTAAASIDPMIDQQVHAMLLQTASTMLGQGRDLAGSGLSFLGAATQATGLAIEPIMREFQIMAQVLGQLTGGFPNLAPGTPPPGPVA